MHLTIESRSGKYNFLDPSEESIQTTLRLFGDDGEVVKWLSATTDEPFVESEGSWRCIAEIAVDILEDSMNRLLLDGQRQKKIEFSDFLTDNADAINTGTGLRKLTGLRQKRDELSKAIDRLELELPVEEPA